MHMLKFFSFDKSLATPLALPFGGANVKVYTFTH